MKDHPRYYAYFTLCRLHQPIGIFLLLWPTLWALWVAGLGVVPLRIILLFILGVILTRTLGCVINDIVDRNLDGHVRRTLHRPLVIGTVSVKEAILMVVALTALAFVVVCQFNRLTIGLASIALVFMTIYPLTKRYLGWPQLFLGLVFGGWPILIAFAAETGRIPPISGLLFLAAYSWCIAYDTIYAMMDRQDDQHVGIRSSALALGQYEVIFINTIETVFVFLLSVIGFYLKVHFIYYVMLLCVIGLFIYQHHLIKSRKPAACFKAFLNNAWIGGLIFLGFWGGLPT
ncbi:4-hydroxybenzoate octaprenyltransferase [Rickettsiella grylli]|uniref:4-hydroxybenzoate octaprenyltransferase n=1 Tax=Rickettsiella grylli TaxID=59196 RepID=A8PML1_9COXI|nr:4-hydroxybenzoate octaprenyltransferase [Rickettsiella grylli]EDP45773.1 4-hydroxybenzoate polyprenyl transferase [Rickettsiella grylli]